MRYAYNLGLALGQSAAANAHRPAIRNGSDRFVTYAELDGYANRLAAEFRRLGLGRHDIVGIVHRKTTGCYAAMIAALKLGAPYVNIDDKNPKARLEHILDNARPKFVVGETVEGDAREAASAVGAACLELTDADFARRIAATAPIEPPEVRDVTGSDPAYVMYTSGSTGVPKGCIISHDNILTFAAWCRERFEIRPDDVLTNFNPMHFDVSVSDVFGALLNGASFAPIGRELLADPVGLLDHVERTSCTIWCSVPSLLIYLSTLNLMSAERLPSIRQIIFCGEVYPKPELRKLYETFGHRVAFVNGYGPTECTCFSSAWRVRADDLDAPERSVPIGPINENCSAAIVDDGRPVKPGEVGELYVVGPQVGLGYYNDPERTAQAFVSNPLNALWHERSYRTGDLVRLDADGRTLHFIGRADNQIKHMGYRIELEEIEAAINRIEGVKQAAVVQKDDASGMKIMAAYVSTDAALTKAQLRERLAALLPHYMVPQHFEIRSTLPNNVNGKVDRVALAAE